MIARLKSSVLRVVGRSTADDGIGPGVAVVGRPADHLLTLGGRRRVGLGRSIGVESMVETVAVMGMQWLTPPRRPDGQGPGWRVEAGDATRSTVQDFRSGHYVLRPPLSPHNLTFQVGVWPDPHVPNKRRKIVPDGAVSLAALLATANTADRWHGLYRLPPTEAKERPRNGGRSASNGKLPAERVAQDRRQPAPGGGPRGRVEPGFGAGTTLETADRAEDDLGLSPEERAELDRRSSFYYVAVCEESLLDLDGDRVLSLQEAQELVKDLLAGTNPLSGIELAGDFPESIVEAAALELAGGAVLPATWPYAHPEIPTLTLPRRTEALGSLIARADLGAAIAVEPASNLGRWKLRRYLRPLAAAAVLGCLVMGGIYLNDYLSPPPDEPPPPPPWADKVAGAGWIRSCAEMIEQNLYSVTGYPLQKIECSYRPGVSEITFTYKARRRHLDTAIGELDRFRRQRALNISPDGMTIAVVLPFPVSRRPEMVVPSPAGGAAQLVWRRKLDAIGVPAVIERLSPTGFPLTITTKISPHLLADQLEEQLGNQARALAANKLTVQQAGESQDFFTQFSGVVYANAP